MPAWLFYDLRTHPAGVSSSAEATAAAIEQVAWADDKGFESVVLTEHHGATDGYLSSPFVLGAAMAARATRIRFVLGAVLLPLHNPLRIAEDTAMLDLVSGGRVTLVLGLGYVPSEFEMFGVPMSQRARLVDEGLQVLHDAFTGEPFQFRGRPARVTPTPTQETVPMIVGGAVPASARRAARFGDGFWPTVPTEELIGLYHDECDSQGRPRGRVVVVTPPMFIHVSEDPERSWSQIAPHAIHEMGEYVRWAEESAAVSNMKSPYSEVPDADGLRASGTYAVVTPDEAVELIRGMESEGRIVSFKPMMGGLSADLAWESLELYAEKVLPAIGKRH